MRDHPAHNVPLLGASWAAQLSQVLLIQSKKHKNISVILSQTFERNGDAAGKRCWSTLSAGRQPLPKGQTRKGTLLSEDSISNSDFQTETKKESPFLATPSPSAIYPGAVDKVYLVLGSTHGGRDESHCHRICQIV